MVLKTPAFRRACSPSLDSQGLLWSLRAFVLQYLGRSVTAPLPRSPPLFLEMLRFSNGTRRGGGRLAKAERS